VVGHVFGPASTDRYIKDGLYFKNHPNNPQAKYQTILSLAVDEKYRKQGIATKLLDKMAEVAKSQNHQAISLTCLPKLFSFYEKRGYENEGKTAEDIP
ncbi:GNAT family N-acetyltransferase, partial [Salmonella enterica subsp. enterica serovar Enteritidis]|nr:GNAT family N-acetyltransferase [Salmonella enterica subsp. enterica serovar Enteritidis]